MDMTLYGLIYSVRYYPRFSLTAVGLGTYYPWIRGSACTTKPRYRPTLTSRR